MCVFWRVRWGGRADVRNRIRRGRMNMVEGERLAERVVVVQEVSSQGGASVCGEQCAV